MQYMGGKSRIANVLTEFMNSELADNQVFVDLFCGSCNITTSINKDRKVLANDLHPDLIALHKLVQIKGVTWLPDNLTEAQYKILQNSSEISALRGFVGFGCSFSGKWFGGYARDNNSRNYCLNAKRSLAKKHKSLADVTFTNLSYDEVHIPNGSYVYCDIPYFGTTKYTTGDFDHVAFYSYIQTLLHKKCTIRVSEYAMNIPSGWEAIFAVKSKQDMRSGLDHKQAATTEVLIRPIGSN